VTGQSGVRFPVEAEDFCLLQIVQISCEATQALIQRVPGFFTGGKAAGA